MNHKAFFKYLFSLLLFGSNGMIAGLIELDSYYIVLLRTLIGSLFLVVLFFMSGGNFSFYKYKKQFLFLILSGISMGTSWMFLYEAYSLIGISIASLLYYCGPVIVMVLSPFLFKEQLTKSKAFGFSIVLIGILLINGNDFASSIDLTGITCGLLSAIMYSFMVIFNKKSKDITGMENATLQLIIAFFTVAIFVGVTQGYSFELSSANILPILVLGLLNTGIGCYFYFSSIGKLKVQTVAVCGYLEPLSAVIFAVLFLGEKMTAPQYIGAVCMIGGTMISNLYFA